MVVGAFPIVKLGALAIKQLSKPLANQIKIRAKKSHFFRTYICMPPAQFYHFFEVTIKMKMLNLGKPVEVPKLNETMAIELGAELLGESVIFLTAAITLTLEYIRSANKEKEREAAREARFNELYDIVDELRYTVIKQDAEIRHLERVLHNKKDIKLKVPFFNKKEEHDHVDKSCKFVTEKLDAEITNDSKPLIFEAVDDAKKAILGINK